jgi:hypothetical protein
MKIRGSGPPITPGGPEETQGSQGAEKAGGPKFAEKLEKAEKTAPADAPAATERTSSLTAQNKLTGDIGSKLEAGQITAGDALDQVVSRILDKQIAKGAPPATRSKVETALRDALETDPVLTAKVRTLSSD